MLDSEEQRLLVPKAPVKEPRWEKVLRVWPNYKTAIAAVCHNDMDVMLDSEITAPSPQFGSATKVKQQLLKEHRRVQAEHE